MFVQFVFLLILSSCMLSFHITSHCYLHIVGSKQRTLDLCYFRFVCFFLRLFHGFQPVILGLQTMNDSNKIDDVVQCWSYISMMYECFISSMIILRCFLLFCFAFSIFLFFFSFVAFIFVSIVMFHHLICALFFFIVFVSMRVCMHQQ